MVPAHRRLVVGIALLAFVPEAKDWRGTVWAYSSRLALVVIVRVAAISKVQKFPVLVAVNRSFDFQSSSAVLFTRLGTGILPICTASWGVSGNV